MPGFAIVVGSVQCPRCNSEVAKEIEIQWGKIPSRYEIGQKIKWAKRGGKVMPSFTQFAGSQSWNCGDPSCRRALVFDGNRFAIDHADKESCNGCGIRIAGVYVDVTDGVVLRIVACTSKEIATIFGNSPLSADIVEVFPDGKFVPHPEWNDAKITYIP